MRSYFKGALLSAAVLAVAMTAQGPAWAQDFTMRLAHTYPDTHIQAGPIRDFVKAVEEKSGGRIKVQVYPSETLVSGREMLDATESGVVEAGILAFANQTGDFPDLELFTYPFMFSNAEHFRRAVNGGIRDLVVPLFAQRNVKLVNFYHKGAMHVMHKSKVLPTPADFSGQRLRSLGPTISRLFTAMSANPINLPIAEVDAAIERGMIDGLTTNCSAHLSRGWSEGLKFVTFLDMSQGGEGLGINTDFFNSLPEDLQKVVTDAATAMEDQEWAAMINEDENVCMSKWKDAAVTVHQVTDEEKAAFQKFAMPIIEAAGKDRPAMKDYLAIAEKTR